MDKIVESDATLTTPAYAAKAAKSALVPWSIERREPRPHDVLIDILYCGVCHSDIHQARDEWGNSIFPMVPGHEIIGKVVSSRMQKTIVVQVVRKKQHPFYGRVVSKAKKFYAHDEKNQAHVGDFVRLEETRPLSKLKRWRLKEVVQRTALLPETAAAETRQA